MTLPLPRNQKNRVAIRRKKIGLLKRRNVGAKKNLTRRGSQLAIAGPVSSWICTSPSWSNVVGTRRSIPFDTVEDIWEELEEGMRLFSEWTTVYEDDDEEVMMEPETHDSLLMAALLSTKEQLPSPSVGRFLSCPDLLMDSLSVLCHCLDEITRRPTVAIPLPWTMEMDPPNSLVSTVSLPSNWDAVSARVSSSSIFNLFSDLPSSIHQAGTGILSTSSTVSVPTSFWDTSSTVSVAAPQPISRPSSTVSIPPSFWDAPEPRQLTSSTSSLFVDPSEASSSISTLFMDPSSAHSDGTSSSPFLTSTTFPSSSALCSHCLQALDPDWPRFGYADYQDSSSFANFVSRPENYQDSASMASSISAYGRAPYPPFHASTSSSSSSSGYETDVDSVPMDMASTLSAVTAVSDTVQHQADCQTSTERLIAECDEMLEKLMEMKKKLREMM
ncbi:hypothetical protein PRIPAC_72643 [Pristionchus pacificus]|uniref:Uncharacterized protein n=1 Tax=Pristionchus pacificus TaxID=54126 RepID=A0A2A6CSR1_PRIPA|nr:hypothetical protein PRIPAC_72643 [Pristionchus pacificus]|eukprot:PDM81252.1 hypothetical protein PRIPAC_36255 [Pristionchus pacificus]